MSEICFECFQKTNDKKESRRKYVISRDLDLCEVCIVKRKIKKEKHRFLAMFLPTDNF